MLDRRPAGLRKETFDLILRARAEAFAGRRDDAVRDGLRARLEAMPQFQVVAEAGSAAEALEALKRPCKVKLHTDSQYLKDGITRWHTGWVRKNWKNATGDPVKNIDLWQRILAAAKVHEVEWVWVRSHVGIALNERADELATIARDEAAEMKRTKR